MIPSKLFNPKCLHPDRDVVFKEDLKNFYNIYISSLFDNLLQENRIDSNDCQNYIGYFSETQYYYTKFENPLKTEGNIDIFAVEKLIHNYDFLSYDKFKVYWKETQMSVLHYIKYKEENTNEYYQIIYKEMLMYLFPVNDNNIFSKIFSIFCLYSIYYTQPYKIKYKINVILQTQITMNNLLNYFKMKQLNKEFKCVYSMVLRLYNDQAFKLGLVLGIKSIILNKYGLPIESRAGVYDDYKRLFSSMEKLKEQKKEESIKGQQFLNMVMSYKSLKEGIVGDLKEVFSNYTSKSNLNEGMNLTKDKTNKDYSGNGVVNNKTKIKYIIKSDSEDNDTPNADININGNNHTSILNKKKKMEIEQKNIDNNYLNLILSKEFYCEKINSIKTGKINNANSSKDNKESKDSIKIDNSELYKPRDLKNAELTSLDINFRRFDDQGLYNNN